MKLFYHKSQRNTFIVFFIIMAVTDMKWKDWGSFDPKDYGFWLAVVHSLLFNLFLNWFIKYPDPNKTKDDETREE